MIIPYQVDVPFDHRPVLNWLIIVGATAAFAMQLGVGHEVWGESAYVLKSLTAKGLLGHMWLHGGLFHIIGNMIFLWVFGNAVCSKVGNVLYPGVYLLVGLMAGMAHLIYDDDPAIGASGAVNGIVGMYLVFYPLNNISCLWMFFMWYGTTFTLSSFWMILFWLAFDIYGAVSGSGGVGYFAHLGGFAAGMGLAVVLLLLGVVKMSSDERSLLALFRKEDDEHLYPESLRSKREDEYEIERSGPGVEVSDEEAFGGFDAGAVMQTRDAVRAAEERKAADEQETVAEEPVEPAVTPIAGKKLIRFHCKCGKAIKVDIKHAGRMGKCPGCRERVLVPGAANA